MNSLDYMVQGCCFPGRCLMPGLHYKHECHTVEMMEQIDGEEEPGYYDDDDFESDICPVCDGVGDIEETCSSCHYCGGSGFLD